jgi:hypothetical protein
MAEYLIMILANEAEEARLSPAETRALVEGHSTYERALRAAETFLDGERLRPSTEGRRVSVRDGQVRVEAGPFPEVTLAAYYLVKAASLEQAVAAADRCPMGAAVDVRPVMNGHFRPEKANEPGRIFGFLVLGNAANEEGWNAIMDRIDANTRDGFPADRFLGGARLHAPTRGKRVTATGGKRAVFDGPFLESKEVIGGLFFMRMANMEEAISWAGQSEFMKHGSLELRELWRS